MAGVAVVGCGPWGRNLVRTLARLGALRAVVDVDAAAAAAASTLGGVPARSLDDVLGDPSVDAVAVAVPARVHAAVAAAALDAGRHVFVEKPMALAVDDADRLCRAAAATGRVLMVGHLMRYHPAFVALHELVAAGKLGRVRYLSSTRFNLGRVRRDEDSLWSFAPHDVSMILALVGAEPARVWATGEAYVRPGVADVTLTKLEFPGGERAQVLVSWLHPYKEQRLVVGGEDAMAVLDDGEPWATKLRLLPHGVAGDGVPRPEPAELVPVGVEPAEPLEVEMRHFLDCVATGARPDTDGDEGLRVLRVLAAAEAAMAAGGAAQAPAAARLGAGPEPHPGARIHPTAVVDEPCEIGDGTAVWHFSHVLAGSRIGRDCTIGQNVMIGPRVVVGDRCKIQNNVSVYEGVTLEDGVFCGPSCVFTNVLAPRAEQRGELRETLVCRGATIGANATVVCGATIGPWSLVAAGAVVTRDVPAHALVMGVPARRVGWVSHAGGRLGDDLVCPRTGRRYVLAGPDRLVEVEPAGGKETAGGTAGGAAGVPDAPAPVAMADLGAQRRRLGDRIDRAFATVLAHTRFVRGPEIARLEAELAAFCGARQVVTCASGTDALLLGLLAHGVGPGDAVAVPDFTFASTAEVVALLGATPVLVDVRPDRYTLDPAALGPAFEEAERRGLRPAGVIAVDLFGHPADYPAVEAAVAGRGLWVMADAAQSFGAAVAGRRVGTLAPLTTTSFFPGKPLGCYGDGGALFTDDEAMAERLLALRAHGKVGDEHRAVGANSRLDTLQAAVLLEKLAILDDERAARASVAERYGAGLAGAVEAPTVAPGVTPAWACYTVRAGNRDRLRARLADDRIATAVYYDRPVGAHPAYRDCPRPPDGAPVADRLCREVLSLPIHPYLDDAAVDRVVAAVRAACG